MSMKCNEFGHWVTGSGKNRRSHTKRKTSYSRELHLLSDDQNRTFRQGEKVVLPFKFDDIIDAPSFYYHWGNSTCYVKWEFSVYLDLDYGSAFWNALDETWILSAIVITSESTYPSPILSTRTWEYQRIKIYPCPFLLSCVAVPVATSKAAMARARPFLRRMTSRKTKLYARHCKCN